MNSQDGQEPADNGSDDKAPLLTEVDPMAVDDLPVIEYRGQRVVTTEHLARLYGTDANNLQVNHSRNRERFEEGKHLFKVEGEELRALKDQLTNCKSVPIPKNASAVILWPAKGACRHAKMLNTDEAWAVYEKMEEAYFRDQDVKALSPVRELTLAERRLRVMERIGAIRMVDQIRRTRGPQAAADSLPGIYADAGVRVSLTRSQAQQDMDLPPGGNGRRG